MSTQAIANPTLNQKLYHYRTNEIMTASPAALIAFLYDQAIIGCKQKDMDRVSKAIVELIDSLNFDYKEISVGLFRLYEFSLREVKQEKYDVALKIFTELRQVWNQATNGLKAA